MADVATPPLASPELRQGRLLRFAVGNLIALLLEAVIGVGLNIYVTVPSSPSFMQVFVSIPLLTAHIALGFLLVAAAGALFALGRRAGVPGLGWRTGLVLLFVVIALVEGFSYVFTNNNAYSAGMAVAFLLALVFEVLVILHLRRAARSPTPAAPSAGIA
jgi:hypothetical protein